MVRIKPSYAHAYMRRLARAARVSLVKWRRNSSHTSEEVRQGHVISKIADAGTRRQWRFVYIFLKASSALEIHANNGR